MKAMASDLITIYDGICVAVRTRRNDLRGDE